MVLSAATHSDRQTSARALDELCRIYWYPLYAFIRRQVASADDAADLTQAFFTQFIERDCLAYVDREKGRFRSFLLVCLRRFLANQHRHDHAAKRGGGKRVLSLDFASAEQRYHLEPAHSLTPEKIYERNWAVAILEQALQVVSVEFAARGRQHIFDTLKVYLVGDDSAPAYAEAAVTLGMSEASIKVAVHRLRDRYREAVREVVGQTMEEGDSLEDELRTLMESMAN
jgi:RNA polymerase sigma-70 factor (ECF subfamily)